MLNQTKIDEFGDKKYTMYHCSSCGNQIKTVVAHGLTLAECNDETRFPNGPTILNGVKGFYTHSIRNEILEVLYT